MHIDCKLHTHYRLTALRPGDYPGGPVPEETFTHSHPSWSSDILYQLLPPTMINSILILQFQCLTVLATTSLQVLFGLPLVKEENLLFSKTPACTDVFSHKSSEVLRLTENECIRLETNEAADKCEQWKITSTVLVQTTELNKSSNNTHTHIPPWAHN